MLATLLCVEVECNASTVVLRVVDGDKKINRFIGVYVSHPVTRGNKCWKMDLQVWRSDARLTMLLCKEKLFFCKIRRSENRMVYFENGQIWQEVLRETMV